MTCEYCGRTTVYAREEKRETCAGCGAPIKKEGGYSKDECECILTEAFDVPFVSMLRLVSVV